MYFVYILRLATGETYKGLTDSVERRLSQHAAGKVIATRKKLPATLIHAECVNTRFEARALEKFFKSGFGREIVKQIDDEGI